MKTTTIILTYHKIFVGNRTSQHSFYDISFDQFCQQIDYLLRHDYNFILPHQLDQPQLSHEKNVILTFDDGNVSDYELVASKLRAHDIPALFFINLESNQLGEKQIIDLSKDPFEIGSHGWKHDPMTTLNEIEQINHLSESKAKLEKIIDKTVRFFAFPHGDYNKKLVSFCKVVGYDNVFSTFPTINGEYPYILHRFTISKSTSMGKFKRLLTRNAFSNWTLLAAKMKKVGVKTIGYKNAYFLRSKLSVKYNDFN